MTVNTTFANMTDKEILNDYKENYTKVRTLLDEESKNDPDNEPYLSKYKAKDVLKNMHNSLAKIHKSNTGLDIKFDAMLSNILLHIGVIDMETDEPSSSEKILAEAEALIVDVSLKPEIIITSLNIYNNLGVLWANREEHDKAKSYLVKSKELYESFKCSLLMPISIERLIGSSEDEMNDILLLEKAHTLTIYYLAQEYGALQEKLKSAFYFHMTLRRQLQYSDFEPIDWALNSATLSQFFAEQNEFTQSRHHLAASSVILDQHEQNLLENQDGSEAHLAKMETFKHRSADVARCWVKYCLFLMSASKKRLMADDEKSTELTKDVSKMDLSDKSVIDSDDWDSKFPDLDVSKYENKITDKYLLTYQDAREVFLNCQEWLKISKDYYTLDSLASDHIKLIEDSSQCYSYLAFFEENDDRRAKMHKRRIDMLEELITKINPVYYMEYCRQIWYELGDIYSELLNIKLERLNKSKEKPDPSALKKVNHCCEKSIENYDKFLSSIKDKSGKLPVSLEEEYIKPVISAYAYIGRNSMKRIAVNKEINLNNVRKSYESYKTVVDICTNNPDAAVMMPEEYSLCRQMVEILQLKIKSLEREVALNM